MFNPYDPTPWDDVINQVSRDTGLPPAYLKTVMFVESGMNPQAQSSAGAMGLMQMTPGAAQDVGMPWEQVSSDPAANIQAGAQYLSPLYHQYGPQGGWAAYNVGPARFADEFGGQISNIPNSPGYQETFQGLNRMQQAYPQGMSQTQMPTQADPSKFRDPFDPNADLTLPGQPIYENAPFPQQPFSAPTGPQMGGPQPGGRMPSGPGSASPNQPEFAPQGPSAGQEQQLAQGPQGPQAPSFQGPPGTINIPTPEINPGFWETLRIAAKNDPSTFYMVLADLAQLNLQGIKQTMQTREQNLLARAELRVRAGQKVNERSQRTVDSIRAKAATAGVLEDYESQIGTIVDSEEEAQGLQAFMSQEYKKRQGEKEFSTAVSDFSKLVSSTMKNPNMLVPKNTSLFKKVFGDQADAAYEAFSAAQADVKERRQLEDEADKERLNIMKERLELARKDASTAQDRSKLAQIRRDFDSARLQYNTERERFELLQLQARFGIMEDSTELEKARSQVVYWEDRMNTAMDELDSYSYGDSGEFGEEGEEKKSGIDGTLEFLDGLGKE